MSNQGGRRPAGARVFFGWWVAWAAGGLYLLNALAFTYGFSLFIEPIGREFGWSRSALSAAWAAALGVGALTAVPAGRAIDRWGPRPAALIGAPLVGLGWLIVTFTDSYPAFFVAFAGLIGLGLQPALVMAGQAAVTNWFRRDRGQAFSIVSTGAGFAGLFGVPALGWLIAAGDWRLAAQVLAGVVGLGALPLAALLRREPARYGLAPDGGDKSPAGKAGSVAGRFATWTDRLPAALRRTPRPDLSLTPGQTRATPVFWLLMAVTGLRFVGMGVVTLHLVAYLQHQGFSPATAGLGLGLGLAASLPGRAVFGWAADRLATRWVLGACLALQAASLIPVMIGDNLAWLIAYAGLWGAGLGSEPLIGSIRAEYFGPRFFGTISGFFMWPQLLGRVAGALIGGAIYDWSGGYLAAFSIAAALFCVAGALSVVSRPAELPAAAVIGRRPDPRSAGSGRTAG